MRRHSLTTCVVLSVGILAHRPALSSTDTWTRLGLEGKVLALVLAPSDPNVLYVGLDQNRGIFKSADAGRSWTQLIDGLTAVRLVVNPANADVLLASCSVYSGGPQLLRSTDGGNTWAQAATRSNRASWILSIQFNPDKPDIVYATAMDTVLRSTDGGARGATSGAISRRD